MAVTLRRLREHYGMTQSAAAELADVALRSYKGYELGERPMPERAYRRLVEGYASLPQSSDRPMPDDPSGQTPGEGLPRQVTSRLLSASSTDDRLVIDRPEGVSDAEWADLRADTWEGYARWLASRVRATVDAALSEE
jgi:transcriptional regulator with XRE-family HTH domain